MMAAMKRRGILGGALLAGAAVVTLSCGASAKDIVLRMAAPDWPPTRFMQEEADRSYKAPSGNNVRLEIDFIPWPSFYERVAASLTSGEQKYTMLVTDSQWLGSFIEGGYYLKLNDYIEQDPELQAIMQDLHPALVSAYSTYPHIPVDRLQTYPDPDAGYYGFPQMPDTYVTWYREDLFCNENEQKAFEEQFSAKLPCTYEDWEEVDWERWEQIGQFFRRAQGDQLGDGTADDDFYGVAYQAGKGYDFSTMAINAFIWQYGGSIWDESQEPEGQAEGVVNSDEAVEAFEHYLSLLQYMPPAAKTGQMDIFQIQELFMQGKVATIIDWVGLGEPVLNPQTSQVHDKAAFALPPGLKADDGRILRWANIGGQPFVLTTWNDEETIKEALDFVKWWESPEVQIKFAQNGGQSGRISVMEMPDYNEFRPWNRAHVEMLDWQRDVWHIPEFFELLTQQQEEFDKAITGQISAREALDEIAEFQQEVLEDAGRIE
jgi:multiple sugar transport system substrate-binding protein